MSAQHTDNDCINTLWYTVPETMNLFLEKPLHSIYKIVIIIVKKSIIIIIIIHVTISKLNRCKTILNIAVHSHNSLPSSDIG